MNNCCIQIREALISRAPSFDLRTIDRTLIISQITQMNNYCIQTSETSLSPALPLNLPITDRTLTTSKITQMFPFMNIRNNRRRKYLIMFLHLSFLSQRFR